MKKTSRKLDVSDVSNAFFFLYELKRIGHGCKSRYLFIHLCIKLKKIISKGIINEVKRQSTKCEKVFVKYTADKQLITKLKSNQLNTMEK